MQNGSQNPFLPPSQGGDIFLKFRFSTQADIRRLDFLRSFLACGYDSGSRPGLPVPARGPPETSPTSQRGILRNADRCLETGGVRSTIRRNGRWDVRGGRTDELDDLSQRLRRRREAIPRWRTVRRRDPGEMGGRRGWPIAPGNRVAFHRPEACSWMARTRCLEGRPPSPGIQRDSGVALGVAAPRGLVVAMMSGGIHPTRGRRGLTGVRPASRGQRSICASARAWICWTGMIAAKEPPFDFGFIDADRDQLRTIIYEGGALKSWCGPAG